MSAADSASAPESFLSRYTSFWLIATTLSLLLGQALAASPIPVPLLAFTLLLVPQPVVFWRAGAALSLGYWRHVQILDPKFPPQHLRSVMPEDPRLYLGSKVLLAAQPGEALRSLGFDRLTLLYLQRGLPGTRIEKVHKRA